VSMARYTKSRTAPDRNPDPTIFTSVWLPEIAVANGADAPGYGNARAIAFGPRIHFRAQESRSTRRLRMPMSRTIDLLQAEDAWMKELHGPSG